MMDGFKYEDKIDLSDENQTYTKSIAMVGSNKKVVDFGCATGFVARVLSESGCAVTGIEIDPQAAEEAARYCDEVIVGNLDEMDIEQVLGPGKYDVGFFGDIIEHLKNPRAALERMRDLLAPGGYVVLSVPNIAHASIRLAILKGRFDYEDTGILDATHLKFYTRESIGDLLESCGYLVETIDSVDQKVEKDALHEALDPLGLANLEEVVKAFSEWEAVAFQYVVKASPATEEAHMQRLSDEKVKAEHRLRVLEREVVEYRKMADNMKKMEAQIEKMEAEMKRTSEYAKAEVEKSGKYAKGLEKAIQDKDAYIAQLEEAVAESKRRAG